MLSSNAYFGDWGENLSDLRSQLPHPFQETDCAKRLCRKGKEPYNAINATPIGLTLVRPLILVLWIGLRVLASI